MADPDPTAQRVGRNASQLRARKELSQAAVVARLDVLGTPMLKTTLSKLENADRKITVDELVALAIALGVSPNRLLLTETAGDQDVQLTPKACSAERVAWFWAAGDAPFPPGVLPDGIPDVDSDKFRIENRPHVPFDTTTDDEIERYASILSALDTAAASVNVQDVPPRIVAAYLRRLAWIHPLRFGDLDDLEVSDGG